MMHNQNTDKYYVSHIDNDITEHSSLEEAQAFIIKEYTEEADGIHPDIETVYIFKIAATVYVEEVGETQDGNFIYEVKFNNQIQSEPIKETYVRTDIGDLIRADYKTA